jgi:putative hydrolase of the HAD superfamily
MPTATGRRGKHRPYKTVLFDLDGTLGDRPAAVARWAEEFYFSQPGLMARVERADAVRQIIEWDAGGHVFAPRLFEKLTAEWPMVRESVDELVRWHAVHYPGAFRPEPAMSRTIRRIMRVGIEWGVVTNGPPFQRDKLVALGLDRLAGCVVISMEFGAGKPEPAIFREALRLLDASAESSIFVGDSPVNDIDGARKAGMSTAWLAHGRTWPPELRPPTHTLDRFSDLQDVLGL